ncbi:hypothetical protein CASFOL_036563 [Castilleja foliolosa]|uniref:MADS-box domain-containing protein n=1 Tax=Castilleja foliolosa TaxID=1961234 RepID=A0ABD3BVX0_9LAMI
MDSTGKMRGRQKIKMAKIENEKSLQVTFSKRRAGLFKKANELATLCGVETAVVVFSPGNRAHSFGHPNVDAISNRFLNEKNSFTSYKANSSQQTLELNQVERQLELEQKLNIELNELARKHGSPEINKLDYNQLSQLKGAILCFRHELEEKVQNGTSFKVPYDMEPNELCPVIPYSASATSFDINHNI